MSIKASVDITASSDRIRQTLIDFHTWPVWSPWLYIEPETAVSYRGEAGQAGHGFDWSGNKTGAGGMTLGKITEHLIECNLQFMKPFKSQADVAFELQPLSNSETRVSWLMNSKLPFFLFWMKNSMAGMIYSDYMRGLTLLKDYVELGGIGSQTTIGGIVHIDAIHYVGSRATCAMSEVSSSMEDSYTELIGSASRGRFTVDGAPFCLYDNVDFKSRQFTYTAALPIDQKVSVNAPLIYALRPACKALKVVHFGPYRHLGNAWSAIMAEAKAMNVKALKHQPPFEVYLNDPDDVDEADLITEIFLPLKD